MQTWVLAEATSGRIVAVDNCREYLDQLQQRLGQAPLAGRVEVLKADMRSMPLAGQTFDLIWCEAAAYIMGVSEALQAWHPLLKGGGYVAFTELVWLQEDRASEAADFFASAYPAMADPPSIIRMIRDTGYRPVSDFTLPDSAWWNDYYGPLERKLPALRHKYAHDQSALGVIAATETEIDMRRRFPNVYGYQFFVARKDR